MRDNTQLESIWAEMAKPVETKPSEGTAAAPAQAEIIQEAVEAPAFVDSNKRLEDIYGEMIKPAAQA